MSNLSPSPISQKRASGQRSAIFSINPGAICLLIVLLVTLMVAGIFTNEAGGGEPASADETPVIVLLVPLSGELAGVGRQLLDAAQMASKGMDVKIEGIDEGESVQQTTAAIAGLRERDEIAAIVGPLRRRHGRAAAREAQSIGVPTVVFSSGAGVEQRGGWIFRGRPDAGEQSAGVVDYLVDELQMDRIAIMASRSTYGDELVSGLIDAAVTRGIKIRAMARYQEDTTDFRAHLQVLTGERAHIGTGRSSKGRHSDRHGTVDLDREGDVDFEALFIADFHDVVARILPFLPGVDIATRASSSGTPVQLMGLSGWKGDGLKHAAAHAEGALFFDTFGGSIDGPTAQEFVLRFRDMTGRKATTPEAEVYDLVNLIGSALQAPANSSGARQAVIDQLAASDPYRGVTGDWSFNQDGAPIRQLHGYRVVDGGEWIPEKGGYR